jgi:hypothetical protein
VADGRYLITLVDAGGPDLPPVEIRLRAALKRCLRAYGLRCVRAVELAEGEAADPRQEVARLRGLVEGLAERVAAQSALLSRRAEKGG